MITVFQSEASLDHTEGFQKVTSIIQSFSHPLSESPTYTFKRNILFHSSVIKSAATAISPSFIRDEHCHSSPVQSGGGRLALESYSLVLNLSSDTSHTNSSARSHDHYLVQIFYLYKGDSNTS